MAGVAAGTYCLGELELQRKTGTFSTFILSVLTMLSY